MDKDGFTDGAIAVLDVLGIKGMWETEPVEQIVQKWERLVFDFRDIEKSLNSDSNNNIVIHIQYFSDTIIVTYEGDDPIDLLSYMSLHLTYPFCHSFSEKVFLRGAISVGKFRRTDNMIIGPAIDEAAKCYEHHKWIGVTLAPSAAKVIDETMAEHNSHGWYENFLVPSETSYDDVWTLNWPTLMRSVMQFIPDTREPRDILTEVFSNPKNDPRVVSKYETTTKFFDEMISRRGEGNLGSSQIA